MMVWAKEIPEPTIQQLINFWAKVDLHGPKRKRMSSCCWVWTGAKSGGGYGMIKRGKTNYLAHRVAWCDTGRTIPSDHDLDHLCRRRSCIRPDHLDPVVRAINCQRGKTGAHNKQKRYCPAGHQYTRKNTLVVINKDYQERRCRTCKRKRELAAYYAHKRD